MMTLAPGDRLVPNSEFVVSNYNATGATVSSMFGAVGTLAYAAAMQKSLSPEIESRLPAINLQAMMTRSLQGRVKPGTVVTHQAARRNVIQIESQCNIVEADNGDTRLVPVVTASLYSDSGSLLWRNAYQRASEPLRLAGSGGWFDDGDQKVVAFLERSIAEISSEIIGAMAG